ncbi:hypothetical protein PENTCL1PPCAC_11780 [Pristionchus entomophagus]|uniref:Protein kinase domain-containing protein n=1 Tax=Pristionchus entomophagus TaxID=358040 RepID=A0AAV5T3G4_9BILA|nr:hypothetical protein PENTCL1PPCAC_11780 [Pristionchus entomophagus]
MIGGIKAKMKAPFKRDVKSKSKTASSKEDNSGRNTAQNRSGKFSDEIFKVFGKNKNSGEFLVRWNHAGPPPLGNFKAGTTVKALEFLKEVPIVTKRMTVKATNMVKVEKMNKGKKEEPTLISAMYLEYVGDGKPKTPVADQVCKAYHVDKMALEGRWFFGRCSPLECTIWLCNRSYLAAGSYLVCQPSFLFPVIPGDWPRFMVVIRLVGGSIEWFHQSWLIDELNNAMARKEIEQFKKCEKENDFLPPPPNDPPPVVAYVIIQRTKEGRYYIEDAEKSFYLLPDLLTHHCSNPIKYNDGKETITLRETRPPLPVLEDGRPIENDDSTFRCPPPPPLPVAIDDFSGTDVLSELVRVPNVRLASTQIRISKKPLVTSVDDHSPTGEAKRAYFWLNNRWNQVSLRFLSKDYLVMDAITEDLLYVDQKSRSRNQALSELNRLKLSLNGFEYVAQIVAGDLADKKLAAWLAYEFVQGMPLDAMLEMRREDRDAIAMRQRYEIMAQIAGGMRFLEQNGLCHRHLNSRNVIVMLESFAHFRVKITDYMVPYSFLNKANARHVNMVKLAEKTNAYLWWPPESINDRLFDIKADIWSFGCVCFEIMNDGVLPYSFEKPSINKITVLKQFFDEKKSMKLTDDSTEPFIHQVMTRCMARDPKNRPPFKILNQFFHDLLFNSKLDPRQVIEKAFSDGDAIITTDITTY